MQNKEINRKITLKKISIYMSRDAKTASFVQLPGNILVKIFQNDSIIVKGKNPKRWLLSRDIWEE